MAIHNKSHYIVYKLTFPNNKIYIGQTKNFDTRMYHYKRLNSTSKLVGRAIKKYGWNNIKKEIIYTTTIKFIDKHERYFIEKYKSNDIKFGYNLESGGNKNKIPSKITRDKIRKLQTGTNNSFYGKKHSDENKKHWSEIKKGKIVSKETKLKLKTTALNRKKIECPHCGKIMDPGNAKQYHFNNCKFLNI